MTIFRTQGGPDPAVFTIPSGAPFLDRLAATLVAECHDDSDPFALADTLVLLPTRRAARALASACLAASGSGALLVPQIRTLGDLDGDPGLADPSGMPDLVPVDPEARLFQLARLIRARDASAGWRADPVAALRAARALAELLDRGELASQGEAGFDWSRLAGVMERTELARHWELSVAFLEIITAAWPEVLAASGQVDPGRASRLRLERLAARWADAPPAHPVIIAGSTGSVRAARALMQVVARLPKGAVVLPGLDQEMTDAAWFQAEADDQHPQRTMAATLTTLGLTRAQVRLWPGCEEYAGGDRRMRRIVLGEALTPKDSTADWPERIRTLVKDFGPGAIEHGLAGLSVVSAVNEEDEASLIALALRETLEQPGKTAALVTPDQTLARRVAAKLRRWDVQVNVSAGEALAQTGQGIFIRLIASWIEDPACPVRLLALLAHPLTRLGLEAEQLAAARDGLERGFLRGPRLDGDLSGLKARILATRDGKVLRHVTCGLAAVADLVERLGAALRLAQAFGPVTTLPALVETVLAVAEGLTDGVSGSLWSGPAGEALQQALAGIARHGDGLGEVPVAGAERLLSALLESAVVRPVDTHPRLAILGPLEARLLSFDRVILGGLNEGVWPQRPAPDPFLAPQMLGRLGLDPPEWRTGLSAHDFAQLAAQPEVLLTSAARRADAPAVDSRWLWRLRTLAQGAAARLDTAEQLAGWVKALQPSRTFDPQRAIPAPRPPVEARNPGKIAVTKVESWVRDPFRFYTEHILRLYALDPVNAAPGTGLRGEAWHKLAEEIVTWPDVECRAAEQQALVRLQELFVAYGFDQAAAEAETARSVDGVKVLLAFEREARARGASSFVEQDVAATVETDLGPITLTARVDRIDQLPDGSLEVTDFKSGEVATVEQARTFYAPQLTLTGLILRDAAQTVRRSDRSEVTLSRGSPGALRYLKLGANPKVTVLEKAGEGIDAAMLVDLAERHFARLTRRFSDPERAYLWRPSVKFRNQQRTYADPHAHFARSGEWADADGEADS